MDDKVFVKSYTVSPFLMNCVVLGCRRTGNAAVVDPGDEAARILEDVAREGLTVSHILLTHGHLDHVTAVAEIRAATGAPIHLHAADEPLYARVGDQAAAFGLPFSGALPPVDVHVRDGQRVTVGDLSLEVMHTPGHSPGSVCYLLRGTPALVLCGDVLFAGSVGRSDLWGGDYRTLMESIGQRLMTLDDDTLVYSGHGTVTTIGDERRTNPFRAEFGATS